MTRARTAALLKAQSAAWNELSGPTARRKPKPMPLLEHAPEPKGQDRAPIERTRRVHVYDARLLPDVKRAARLSHLTTTKADRMFAKAKARELAGELGVTLKHV